MNLSYGYTASAGQHGAGSAAGNNGLLMSVSGTINGQTESAAYTYDLLGRLATANQTTYDKATVTAQRRFSYDRWGNRTGVWDATSGGNQIQSLAVEQTLGIPTNRISSVTQGATVNYTYDRNGNVVNDGVHSYQYDGENRVVSVDSGTTAQYSYNHRNQRVKKVAGGATLHYVCHKEGALAEYNGATGAVLVQYISLGHQQIAKIESGVTSYFLSDSLSARVVLDGNGNVIGRQTTLPFGEALATDGTTDKRLFTSYERDTESGNDEAWHRKYAYTVGRFNSADPYKASGGAANPQSWNRYSYVLNNPINSIDPMGLLRANPEPRPYHPPGCGDEGGTDPPDDTPSGDNYELVPLPNDLRSRLEELLSYGDCANFVRRLINQVANDTGRAAYSDYVLEIFDAVSSQRGYVLRDIRNSGEAHGTIAGGNAQSQLSPYYVRNNWERRRAIDSYVVTTLHETIHFADPVLKYSDRELAQAAVNLLNSDQLTEEFRKISANDVGANSNFWHKILRSQCPGPPFK